MKKTFAERIVAMNAMYKLPANDAPTLPADVVDRLTKFKATLLDEVHEIDEIVKLTKNGANPIEILVAVAVTDSGRPLPRVGGLTAAEAVGKDGLR